MNNDETVYYSDLNELFNDLFSKNSNFRKNVNECCGEKKDTLMKDIPVEEQTISHDIPGYTKEEINVTFDDERRAFIISAKNKIRGPQKFISEVYAPIDESSVKLGLDLGVLTIKFKYQTKEKKQFTF